jgi:hypothetical protein
LAGHASTERLYRGPGFRDRVGVDIAERNINASLGKGHRGCGANTSGSTNHRGDLSGQVRPFLKIPHSRSFLRACSALTP